MDLDAAVDAAVDEMPEEFVIREFIVANRAEVKAMLFTEYNEEKILEKERQEGRQEGRQEAFETVAATLLREGEHSVPFIARISQLSEDAVRKLARTMGISLA